MSELQVELYGEPLGVLRGDARTYDFVAHARALDRYGLDRPLKPVRTPGRRRFVTDAR